MKSHLCLITSCLLIQSSLCQITTLFESVNSEALMYNAVAAQIAWVSSVDPDNPELPARAASYQQKRIRWQQHACAQMVALSGQLNDTQSRQTYLLCRGPRFTFEEARKTSMLYEELQSIYSDSKICIATTKPVKRYFKMIEDAILNYLSTARKLAGPEVNDTVGYAAKLAAHDHIDNDNDFLCLYGEEDVGKMMEFSMNEEVLRWLWMVWREKVGPPMKRPYRDLVNIENVAAKRNGYADIGASWRDELEIPDLKIYCHELYSEVKPLYQLLHGVVRYFLRQFYGNLVPEKGLIPAHLLGDLWSQNWASLIDFIAPSKLYLDESIQNLNWNITHMVKRAEDFYQSLGLPAMTSKFWRESVLTRPHANTRCHGTAADMFQDDDYRLLYCSRTTSEDLYVIHHELGHIQYYMAYAHQPGVFRQANSAFHEAIGDTIMLGVMAPQHLHRLGLINDTILYKTNLQRDNPIDDVDVSHFFNTIEIADRMKARDKTNSYFKAKQENVQDNEHTLKLVDNKITKEGDTNTAKRIKRKVANPEEEVGTSESPLRLVDTLTTDEILILQLGLNKIPQIPFALLMDEYRWRYFSNGFSQHKANAEFWKMAKKWQGIEPPVARSEEYFDAGAKYHIPDNTPYIRYFLSAFLQHQLFESLCKAAVFGRRNVTDTLPNTIAPHTCDIYGSKAAGRVLKDLMSSGHSRHWHVVLHQATGRHDISPSALKRYYRPLYKLLTRLVKEYSIPIGW